MANINEIDKSLFEFAQLDASIHDQKLDTEPVGYLRDAFRRFRKNRGSIIAACIILMLVLFAIFAPIISNYDLSEKDTYYKNKTPFWMAVASPGFWDGGQTKEVNENMYRYLRAIGVETGRDPILEVRDEYDVMQGGKKVHFYKIRMNTYYYVGVINTLTITAEEFEKICKYQDETGIQIIYPYVDDDAINGLGSTAEFGGNYWYKVNKRGAAQLDANGNYVAMYAHQNEKNALGQSKYLKYNSLRIASDPYTPDDPESGYAYCFEKQGVYSCRINYFEYYRYKNGKYPNYLFGTNEYGQDILNALGRGARFSLILAICVSIVNLLLGTIYGAIEGYYGGKADMIMERISDILSGIPLMIVVTLFNAHLAAKVGVIPAFLLAFVATGWIGMASLVRKQFYRFKGQEYVLAARTLGASDMRVMFKHIFPNSIGTIITSCVLVIPGVIGSETMLTYLGIINLSDSNSTTIGVLMEQGTRCMTSTPHVLFFPALFLALLMISFNLFGNGLRDAFNPSLRGSEG